MADRLVFPFGEPTDFGAPRHIGDGLYWLRMPLPFSLSHVNVYLLEGKTDWTIIDTGFGGQKTEKIWRNIFAKFLPPKPVGRIIATHCHPDHMGQSGFITQRWNCPLWMTRNEYLQARILYNPGFDTPPPAWCDFMQAAGYDPEMVEKYRQKDNRALWRKALPLPVSYHRLCDGQMVTINGEDWEIVVGSGHSPEHMCLYHHDKALFLAGDQLLPRISSNISVYPTEPEADPLKDWLSSCALLPDRIKDDVLVLPAHGAPFRGLHARCKALRKTHETRLKRLQEQLKKPRRAIDCLPILYRRAIGEEEMGLAIGEALAHLHCLMYRGLIMRQMIDGVHWYKEK